jgi:LuxR family maltose regulon positive regulatory protein
VSSPLLSTKLYIPPLRPELVPRPHLLERLDAGLHHKLILISAPAGFGKTTLLSAWINTKYPIPNTQSPKFAWLSLDEDDDDPTRFMLYLVAALQRVEASIGQGIAEALLSPGLAKTNAPPSNKALLTTLINQIVALPELFLVLDDYHLITSQAIHDALAFLLARMPDNLHLVIAARADPPLPLARLRARGQLTELRQNDLRFSPDQAAQFIQRVTGLELPTDAVAALASRTEGWIAGLQMAAASLQNQSAEHAANLVQTFSGSNRYVLDYLLEEVLQQQPEHIQTFLLQTSILDRLTAPLCAAVVKDRDWRLCRERSVERLEIGDSQFPNSLIPNPHSLLEQLESSNLFIVPLDDERRWYRYHRLFADLLRGWLLRQEPDLAQTLHLRASRWYEERAVESGEDELLGQAIKHALAAGDEERAAGLVEQIAEATLMRSQVTTLLRWLDALPNDVARARPRLCALHAGALLLSGSPLDAVQARLQDAEQDASAAGEAAAFRAMIATFQGDGPLSAEFSRRALELLPQSSLFLRSMTAENQGVAHLLNGDTQAAIQAFEQAAQVAQKAGNVMIAVGALSNIAGLHMARGRLHQAAELYRRVLKLASDEQGRPLPIAGKVLLGLGELSREWNELDAATRYLTQGIELTAQYIEIGAVIGYISLARIKQAQADLDGAQDLVSQAQQLALKFDAARIDDLLVSAYQARLWLARGDVPAALRWAQERGLEQKPPSSFHEMHEFEHITLAQIYLAQGQPDAALRTLKPLLQAAEKLERGRSVIKLLILQALALAQTPRSTDAALAALGRALSLAEPQGYVRAFVDEGQPMARLLYQAAAQGIMPEYAGKLLAAFETETPAPKIEDAPLVEPLSQRELEILNLIAEGLSNQEIAGRAHVSINTVKSHIRHIYGKLGVNSRTQAVARAKDLGILP